MSFDWPAKVHCHQAPASTFIAQSTSQSTSQQWFLRLENCQLRQQYELAQTHFGQIQFESGRGKVKHGRFIARLNSPFAGPVGGVRETSSSVLKADLMGCPWAFRMGVEEVVDMAGWKVGGIRARSPEAEKELPDGLVPHYG